MMDILPGAEPLISDVRQSGSSPSLSPITYSTVERNTAEGGPGTGGGIYRQSPSSTVTVDHSHVRDNTPDNRAPSGSVPGCTD